MFNPRERILLTALRLFAQDGYEAVSGSKRLLAQKHQLVRRRIFGVVGIAQAVKVPHVHRLCDLALGQPAHHLPPRHLAQGAPLDNLPRSPNTQVTTRTVRGR